MCGYIVNTSSVILGMAKKEDAKTLKELDAQKEMKQVGNRIKQLRKEAGYTSYEVFCNEHEIHRVQWGRYEQGQDLYTSTLIKICKLFRISLKEFFSQGFDN